MKLPFPKNDTQLAMVLVAAVLIVCIVAMLLAARPEVLQYVAKFFSK
jgi:hypothetical protein